MRVYLGIDLGTGSVKALLLTENGTVLGAGSSQLTVTVPKAGYAVQSPQDWWNGTVAATRQALASCDKPPEVAAVGISGQMVGSVLMDNAGNADDECIIWMDQRAVKQRDSIVQSLGMDAIIDKTANFPLVSLWAPKLLWLRENEPEKYENTDKVLFPKDYIKYRLTGEYDIDVTDASATILFNTAKRRWEEAFFKTLDIPFDFVKKTVSESADVIGVVREKAALELGITKGTLVVSGGGDQICSAAGLGVVRSGVVSSVIGTSGCVFAYSDTCITERKGRALLSNCHCMPAAWSIFGCTLAAGGSYRWLHDTLFCNEAITEKNMYTKMNSLAEQAKPGCEGLLYLPYLSGERTPHADPLARGVFFGLSHRHGAPEFCRAVMEGVTYSLRDTVEIFREFGISVTQVRASGGGSESDLWRQMQADIFGAQVVVTNIRESAATGAAMLAAVGVGDYSDMQEAADDIVRVVGRHEPNPAHMHMYDDYFETYRALYPALRPIYAMQAEKVEKYT